MQTTKRRTDAERIAFATGCDFSEMRDCRYQPTRYKIAVYAISDQYFCVPRGRKLPDGFDWRPLSESYGETVYTSHQGD